MEENTLSDEYFLKGNYEYQNSNFEKALKLYTLSIENFHFEKNEKLSNYFSYRSSTLNKLNNFEEALFNSNISIQYNSKNPEGYKNKAIALYNLKEYENSLLVLEKFKINFSEKFK